MPFPTRRAARRRGKEGFLNGTRPLVIVGVPRSGTTWTHEVLARGAGVVSVPEPDNENWRSVARHAKSRVGRFPLLVPGEDDGRYRDLWEWAISGARSSRRDQVVRRILGPVLYRRLHDGRFDPAPLLGRSLDRDPRPADRRPGRVVVKSVHVQLALEWLVSVFDVDVLLVFRHPADVLASWIEVDLLEGEDTANAPLESREEVRRRYTDRWGVLPPGPDRIERMCWRIGLLQAALEEAASHHPEWHRRTHELLCSDPAREFRQLYEELGLTWTPRTDKYLDSHNAPGTGFQIKRVASELPGSWRNRLNDRQLDVLRTTLARFPNAHRTDSDFDHDAGVEL